MRDSSEIAALHGTDGQLEAVTLKGGERLRFSYLFLFLGALPCTEWLADTVERDGDALRFTHPLLRSVLYAEMTLNQRRHVHQRLAAIVGGIEERAWHLALGAEQPSEEIAETLDGAAEHAESRGAPQTAAVLEEQATRLTPASDSGKARERSVRAADYHFRGGNIARSRELVESALGACPAGPAHAALLVRLGTIHHHEGAWPMAEKV